MLYMKMNIQLYQRPSLDNPAIVDQVHNITNALVGEWFTPDVPEGIHKDLMFHDVICLEVDNKVVSYIIFTSLDGIINILYMGTNPEHRGKGYGSRLMEYLFDYGKQLGFTEFEALTVPPESKPSYTSTVEFYKRHGFVIEKYYTELWKSGALKLVKKFVNK